MQSKKSLVVWAQVHVQAGTPPPHDFAPRANSQQHWGKSDVPLGVCAAVAALASECLGREYSLRPGISGCSLWLSQCPGGSRLRRSPADSAERTSLFFIKKISFLKKRRNPIRPLCRERGSDVQNESPAGQQEVQGVGILQQ